MKTKLEGNNLTLYLDDRIDANNAPTVEQEIMAAISDNPGVDLTIDVGELEYISSAGLRVLMKLRKQAGAEVPVINASPEVYEIFEVTGFAELFKVMKALRQLSVEGLPVIGVGATVKVYRIDRETVVKVFRPEASMQTIRQENERSKNAFLYGIPTAISYDILTFANDYTHNLDPV